jgi:hypothetical protein
VHLRRPGLTVGLLAGVLLATVTACSTSSDGTGSTMSTEPVPVGRGAQNFQLRPVLHVVAGGAVHCPSEIDASPEPAKPTVVCSIDQSTRYALGPAFVTGEDAVSATAGQPQNAQDWVVNVNLTEQGSRSLLEATTRLYQLRPPRNRIAVLVDGFVVSAPAPSGPIDGGVEISGNFDEQRATVVAQRIVPSS